MREPILATRVPIPSPDPRLEVGDRGLALGSCFTEAVPGRLARLGFPVCVNPTGYLYHPLSAAAVVRRLLAARPFTGDDLVRSGGLWAGVLHHGEFSASEPEAALDGMNRRFREAGDALGRLDCLWLTFGTAMGWFLRGRDDVPVANCHRLPESSFERYAVTADRIVAEWSSVLEDLFRRRPGCRVVITVSPVRHLRNSPRENSLSKAQLLLAAAALEERFPTAYVFPAYEIMLDELRDYRYYDRDLAHPNEVARDIIFGRFVEACLSDRSKRYLDRAESLREALEHRPRDPGAPAHRDFLNRCLEDAKALGDEFPSARLKPVIDELLNRCRLTGTA